MRYREGRFLFWLTVSEVTVDSWLPHCFQTCDEAEHHGRHAWSSRAIPFMAFKSHRRGQGQEMPFKGMTQ
jgi:hypothetical protein